METSKAIILSTAIIVALAIILLIIQLLLRKAKNKSAGEEKLQLSFGSWFASLFLPGSLIMLKAITVFSTAFDNICKISPAKILPESFKTGSLFIGISILWLLLWYFIVNILSVLVTGKRNAVHEFAADNYLFFLIRGMVLLGFTICLLPVFEIILRTFVPDVQIPFYH